MRRTLLLFGLLGVLIGCGERVTVISTALPPTAQTLATMTPGRSAMSDDLQAGPLPESLDLRLERRDRTPLPEGAFVRFQSISIGPNQTYNYRWLLYNDGRWFLAKNSGADMPRNVPFDTELPATPTRQLTAAEVQTIRDALDQAQFLSEAPYIENTRAEGGSFSVVTAHVNGTVHEVIYVAHYPPLVELLRNLALTQ